MHRHELRADARVRAGVMRGMHRRRLCLQVGDCGNNEACKGASA